MELTRLIEGLSAPEAYPAEVRAAVEGAVEGAAVEGVVEVRQTHISVVFLVGPYAYKIKKPVAFGFVDFSTPAKRRHFCDEEVRLNRRLAPRVYVGVVPVTRTDSGLRMEGEGEAVEWGVKMRRLPDSASLEARLGEARLGEARWGSEFDPGILLRLADRLAAFHTAAQRGQHIAPFGSFTVVAGNARDNFTQAAPQVGVTISPAVFARLRALTEQHLAAARALIEARAARGVPCDTHGDLRLEHVYVFPEQPPPDDLMIVDCIEFNERFRFADPVADMAFLVMDLIFHGRRDLARAFAQRYFQAAGDDEGRTLLPFYTAYRAAVRGKVEGLELAQKEVPERERDAARRRAQAHWLVALTELETPGRKPCLVLVGGLPGTGKSTLARQLTDKAGFTLVRSDVVRKELAGRRDPESQRQKLDDVHYSEPWTERTYAECLRRAEDLLFAGQRVLIDANFREERRRRPFLEAARAWGVPAVFLVCRALPHVVRARLRAPPA